MKILVSDPIADDGVKVLQRGGHQVDVKTGLQPAELKAIIGEYSALAVRSETKVTAEIIEAGVQLQIIGRAGVGVDNIDLDAATQRGVIVVNAPAGNIVTTAEHSLAMLFAVARNIPQAHASVKAGEWKRSKYVGIELRDKVLGIVGLGKVGSEVARRAAGLDMHLVVFDPYASEDQVRLLGAELVTLAQLLERSDFVTVHTPLTDSTRGMIGAEQLAMMKPTARIVNCARGGIIDEQALYDAVEAGTIAGAAVDVFTSEPAIGNVLLTSDRIVVTPHLGASTEEAQVNVAVDIAEQILAVLAGGQAKYAVNMPLVAPEALKVLTPFMGVAVALGELAIQMASGQLGDVRVEYAGDIAAYDTSILTASLIKGIVEPISDVPINLVNARSAAEQRGLTVIEQKGKPSESYTSLVTVTISTSEGDFSAAGTVFSGTPHIVMLDGYRVDIVPNGTYWLLSKNLDRPGMIGSIGTLLGTGDVNINTMQTGREKPRGEVLMVLGVDEPIPDAILDRIKQINDIHSAKLVKL